MIRPDTPDGPRARGESWIARSCAVIVAGVAAYSSYAHQRDFALDGGADPVTAALWPLSVDGLVILASLGLLRQHSETSRRTRWAVRSAFLLGVIVSLAANIAAAPTLAWQPIVVAGWPPLALLLGIELILHTRHHRQIETNHPRTALAGETATNRETDRGNEIATISGETARVGEIADHTDAETVGDGPVAETAHAARVTARRPAAALVSVTTSPSRTAGGLGRAEDIMWSYYQRALTDSRTPTGAELDRIAGTSNYGRAVLARWRRTGRLPPAA